MFAEQMAGGYGGVGRIVDQRIAQAAFMAGHAYMKSNALKPTEAVDEAAKNAVNNTLSAKDMIGGFNQAQIPVGEVLKSSGVEGLNRQSISGPVAFVDASSNGFINGIEHFS